MSSTASNSFGGHPGTIDGSDEGKIMKTEDLVEPPKSELDKLHGFDLWNDMGNPKYVVAPMVDQSELAWRILSRLHGANLCYTPMFHAALFSTQPKYQHEMFDLTPNSIEGVAPYDRPLVVQFCANDKDQWLESAKKVVGRCDAVDLNLGCPQGIARRGRYGAFLMEEWDLIRSMISHLHENLSIPVTAKIRCYPTLSKTLDYASHVFSSGAQILTVHGRTREMKGQMTGFASWDKIRSVVNLIQPKIPVFANGGTPGTKEIEPCLEETGANGIMSAEGNLYNPMIFSPSNWRQGREYLSKLPEEMRKAIEECDRELEGDKGEEEGVAYAPAPYLAAQYLSIVLTIPNGTQTATSAIKAHLYKMFRPIWAKGHHLEMREKLGKAGSRGETYRHKVEEYVAWNDDFRRLIKSDLATSQLPSDSYRRLTQRQVDELYAGEVPYSHCQPYLRVSKPEDPKEERELKKVDLDAKRKRELEEEPVLDDTKRSKPSPASPSTPLASSTSDEPPICANHSSRIAPTFPTVPEPASTNDGELPKPCTNSGSTKCSNLACKACCQHLRRTYDNANASSSDSNTTMTKGKNPFSCEFHETKEGKERQRQEELKAHKLAKKERGKVRQMEQKEKNRVENERKREEREKNKKEGGGTKVDVEGEK